MTEVSVALSVIEETCNSGETELEGNICMLVVQMRAVVNAKLVIIVSQIHNVIESALLPSVCARTSMPCWDA